MVYVLYFLFIGVSLVVGLLLAEGVRIPSPARWIESLFKMTGVLKQ